MPKNTIKQCKDPLWSAIFVLIMLCALCAYMVVLGLNSGMSVYLERMGYPAVMAGVLASVFSICAAIVRLAIGPYIDNHGRMKAVSFGAWILFVGCVLPLLTNNVSALVISRIFQGIGFSIVTTSASTAAIDVLPTSRLGEGIGYLGLSQAFAQTCGPALAMVLVMMDPSINLFIGMTTISAVGIVISYSSRYEKDPKRLHRQSSYWQRFYKGEVCYAKPSEWVDKTDNEQISKTSNDDSKKNISDTNTQENSSLIKGKLKQFVSTSFEKRAFVGAIPMVFITPAFGLVTYFAGMYGVYINASVPGMFYTIAAITMICARFFSGKYMDTIKPIKLYSLAMLCGVVAFSLMICGSFFGVLFYAASIFYGVCIGIAHPVIQAIAIKNTPADRWGAANAMVMLAYDIGAGCASIIWGILIDCFGFALTFCVAIAIVVCAFVVAKIMFPKADCVDEDFNTDVSA